MNVGVGGSNRCRPGKHVLPQTSRMTEAERINLMAMVRDKKMGLDQAIDKAIEAEEMDEKLICVCREDMIHTNTIHVDMMLCVCLLSPIICSRKLLDSFCVDCSMADDRPPPG